MFLYLVGELEAPRRVAVWPGYAQTGEGWRGQEQGRAPREPLPFCISSSIRGLHLQL